VRVLGGFRATSVRAGRSVCCHGTRRAPLGDFGSGAVAAGNEGRKEGSGARAGGWDGTGRDGRTAGRTPFLSLLSILAGYFKKGSGRGELGGKRCIDGFQEAIIIPTDVDG